MKVVGDTNILLVSISRRSPFTGFFQRLLNGEYNICVTTEILSEYAEKIEEHMGVALSEVSLKAMFELPNLEKIDAYYKWNLIKYADDNKFPDCAIAAGALYIVTHDRDFNVLKDIAFPKVEVISAATFNKSNI